MNGKPWTPNEEGRLIREWRDMRFIKFTMRLRRVAAEVGRTPTACKRKLEKLGELSLDVKSSP